MGLKRRRESAPDPLALGPVTPSAPLVYPEDLAARQQVERMEALAVMLGAHPLDCLPQRGQWWVYLLLRADRFCLYVGQSDSLASRMTSHQYTFGDQVAAELVIRCRDDFQASVRELFLIDELQPPYNSVGALAHRKRVRTMASPSKWTPRNEPDPYAPVPGIHDVPAEPAAQPAHRLDPGQATG